MRFAGALGDDDIPMGTYIIMPVYFLPGFLGDYLCGACDMLCSSEEADEKKCMGSACRPNWQAEERHGH